MSIADELQLLINTKEQIRLAVGASKDVPFSTYVDLIDGNTAPQLTVDQSLIGIERQAAILANTKESLRVVMGLSKDVPFSQYASYIPKRSTVFDFVDNQYSKDQLPVNLSDISEFIRLSSATMWQDVQLVEVANNIPRISVEGLLIEPQRTNSFPDSVVSTGNGVIPTTLEVGEGNVVPAVIFTQGASTFVHVSGVLRPSPGVMSAYVQNSDNSKPTFTGSATGAGVDFVFILAGNRLFPDNYTVSRHGDVYRVSGLSLFSKATGISGITKYVANSAKDVTATYYQVEDGDTLTSLIKSSGSPATRAPDILNIPLLPSQTITGDWDEGVTYSLAGGIATFTGQGYIRNITVEAL